MNIYKKIDRLIKALLLYYEVKGSYYPVYASEMIQKIDTVIELGKLIDNSSEACLNRLFGHDDNTRKLNEAFEKLVNLARALTDYDANIHDTLLYIDGHITE